MEIIAIESQAYQEMIERLNRIEQYVLLLIFFKILMMSWKCQQKT